MGIIEITFSWILIISNPEMKSKAFRQEIIALKKQGYKTEPAFAMALGLKGDPYYKELLNYLRITNIESVYL